MHQARDLGLQRCGRTRHGLCSGTFFGVFAQNNQANDSFVAAHRRLPLNGPSAESALRILPHVDACLRGPAAALGGAQNAGPAEAGARGVGNGELGVEPQRWTYCDGLCPVAGDGNVSIDFEAQEA